MHVSIYLIRLKSYLKLTWNENSLFYKIIRSIYHSVIFPIERSLWIKDNNNGFESENALHMCSLLPKITLKTVIENYHPKSWLDIGCGTGVALKYVKQFDIKIEGVEFSSLAIKESKIGNVINCHDLTKPLNLNKKFDVVWCYEVAEHLPENSANNLINILVTHGNIIVLSAARPGQGGEGHINEQPIEYWINKMAENHFSVDKGITTKIQSLNELYSENVCCFTKNKS